MIAQSLRDLRNRVTCFSPCKIITLLAAWIACSGALDAAEPLAIGSRLEPFIDSYLIDRLDNVRPELGQPREEEIVLHFGEEWEKATGYVTILHDRDIYRMYYRGVPAGKGGEYDDDNEVTCYAESRDGIHWEKPKLRIHEFRGSLDNNIIIARDPHRMAHNFAPFLDDRPGVPADERYKAVGGVFYDQGGSVPDAAHASTQGGLYRYVSADGIHWQRYAEQPLFPGYALDSLNAPAWVESEQVYALYLRTWSEGGTPEQPKFRGFRTISRSTSKDFKSWTKPEPMTFGNTPLEHLYTNGTHPYFRAPHLLIALPFRFWPARQALSTAELTAQQVPPSQRKGISDVVLMTTRGGSSYERLFMESFIRPGLDRKVWHARDNMPALGVVQTGPSEMSLYLLRHYVLPDSHVRRYSLRLDGLAFLRAPYAGGSVTTKPLTFSGRELVLNYSTSAAGSLKVELLDESGQPHPGFGAGDCDEIIGDEIARKVTWRGRSDLQALAGRIVRVRFLMKDASLYSLRFADK